MGYRRIEKELFHVHTFRCGHASDETDEDYVKKAIGLGAKRIVFTDHVPFPANSNTNPPLLENPFRERMNYESCQDYIDSVNNLKKIYKDKIEILCGFEVEYLPSYLDYYKKLKNTKGVDLLIVGQHFYEYENGGFSCLDKSRDYKNEYIGQCRAMIRAVKTGLFDVVAHPDRSFRFNDNMSAEEIIAAKELINAVLACKENRPYFEKNYTSKHRTELGEGHFYKEQFFDMLPEEIDITYGLDAHSTDELEEGFKYWKSIGI